MFFLAVAFFSRRTRRMVIILIKVNIILISAAGAKIFGYIPSLHSSITDQFNALTAVSTAAAKGMLAGYAGTRARHRTPARSAPRVGGARRCARLAARMASI